ncbi:MAG: hypothetical protein HC905_11560 [Bacteroidales bacterium]|nr:hypothetical protein [Bacteroidales bacterium]
MANAFINIQNYGEAFKCIKTAMSADMLNTKYLFTLATIHYKKNEIQKALNTIKSITELDPTDEEAWMFYSEILLEQSQIDDAIKALLKAMGHIEESSVLNYRIGSYYMLKGNEKLSFKYFEKGLKLNYQDRQIFFEYVPDASLNPKIIELLSLYN